MSKILVVRKSDKTVHRVTLDNKALLMNYSNNLPAGEQWKFEEMDEAAANKLEAIDESYVTAAEAQMKAKDLQKDLTAKDAMIAELQAQLAKNQKEEAKAKK